MSITLRKVNRIYDKVESQNVVVNCLSWFSNNILDLSTYPHLPVELQDIKIPLYQVSPYYLKDANGCIFECVWQAQKLYPKVYTQNQFKEQWYHPEEVHVDDKGNVLPAYWNWRQKLLYHSQPVRYPNGYHSRHTVLCSLWFDNNEWKKYSYFESRLHVYVKEYAKLVKQTEAFRLLKHVFSHGINLNLMEIDCVDNVVVSVDTFNHYLTQQTPAFGHTWTLALCLLGIL